MRPLLKIQSIPIKIEAQTRRASLQYSAEPVPASKPAPPSKIMSRSAGRPAPQPPVKITGAPANPAAQQAEKAVQQRQAEYTAQQGAYPNTAQVDSSAASVADTVIGQALMSDYVSNQPAAQTAEPSTSVDYQMDRTTFDWSTTAKPQLEFVPAQIEYTITQYPQLIIEYVGEPIYVPASANPNYKGTA